jgi:hypothetical protein
MSDALRDARSRLGMVNSANDLTAARPGPIHHQRRRGRTAALKSTLGGTR